MTSRRWLILILAAYLILATTYSIVTPIFEASDELWHYPMVKYLADNGLSLPRPDPAQPWRQEGGQPPLYYIAAAVLTGGIDTSDMDVVRRVNPHSDIGVVRPDRNANMMVHRASEAFPWHGTVLAVHVARFFSVLLGLGTVLVTYLLARAVFPDWPLVALGAAALNAFLPMFLFISGSVNNDNMSNLLGNLLTLLIVRLVQATEAPRLRDFLLLGVVAGAGLLSKLNIGFLIPLVALALVVVSLRLRSWRPLLVGGLVSGALTIGIAGWWYLRNWQLYGDPTGLNAFLDTVGRRLIPANTAQLWAERHSFTQAYWGFFGGVNVPLPDTVYLIFNVIGGAALLSAVVYLLVLLARRQESLVRWLVIGVSVGWPLVTFISYLRWTAETPASQGRLVFGALSAISLWMAVGLVWWLPRRWQPLTMSTGVGFFAVVAALAPFTVIAPMYAPPANLGSVSGEPLAVFREPETDAAIRLLRADVTSEVVHPGEYVFMDTRWALTEPLTRDWSLFIHLTTPEGVIISQRDIYPGGGTLATSDLAGGWAWDNPIAVNVPRTAYAPTMLDVRIGWYHLPTGQRLALAGGEETVAIGSVRLEPNESSADVPNPVSVNFDNQIELIGYAVSDLTPNAGDTVQLRLYWRALGPIERDYTVFAHIIEPRSFTIYAGSDAWPASGNAPTSTWQTGAIIEDTHTLSVNADTPPDIYELELGLYYQDAAGAFRRLRVVTADGGMADDYVYLTRVRTLPRDEADHD
jgi:4-amino-4-deoxy-L-arabinose transferase-like glycosyltransferase